MAYQARNLRNELTALHKRQVQRCARASLPSSDSSVTSSPREIEFAQVDAQLEMGATNEALKHAVSLLSSVRGLLYWALGCLRVLYSTYSYYAFALSLPNPFSTRPPMRCARSVGEQYAEIFNFGRALLRCLRELTACANMFLSRAHPLTDFIALVRILVRAPLRILCALLSRKCRLLVS